MQFQLKLECSTWTMREVHLRLGLADHFHQLQAQVGVPGLSHLPSL